MAFPNLKPGKTVVLFFSHQLKNSCINGLEGTDVDRHAFRPIGFQRNQELSILQIRNNVPEKIAGVQWVAFGPNSFNGIAPYYTNILDTPSTYRDTKEHFDIQDMYWLTHAITTIADEHPFSYSASIER